MKTEMKRGNQESVICRAQLSAAEDAAVRGDPPTATDQDMIDCLGCDASVAVPRGMMNSAMLEPSSEDLEIVRRTQVQHPIAVVIG